MLGDEIGRSACRKLQALGFGLGDLLLALAFARVVNRQFAFLDLVVVARWRIKQLWRRLGLVEHAARALLRDFWLKTFVGLLFGERLIADLLCAWDDGLRLVVRAGLDGGLGCLGQCDRLPALRAHALDRSGELRPIFRVKSGDCFGRLGQHTFCLARGFQHFRPIAGLLRDLDRVECILHATRRRMLLGLGRLYFGVLIGFAALPFVSRRLIFFTARSTRRFRMSAAIRARTSAFVARRPASSSFLIAASSWAGGSFFDRLPDRAGPLVPRDCIESILRRGRIQRRLRFGRLVRKLYHSALERILHRHALIHHQGGGALDGFRVWRQAVLVHEGRDFHLFCGDPALVLLRSELVLHIVNLLLVIDRVARVVHQGVEKIGNRRFGNGAFLVVTEIARLGRRFARLIERNTAARHEADEPPVHVLRLEVAAVVAHAAHATEKLHEAGRHAVGGVAARARDIGLGGVRLGGAVAALPRAGVLAFQAIGHHALALVLVSASALGLPILRGRGGFGRMIGRARLVGGRRRRHRLLALALRKPFLQVRRRDFGDRANPARPRSIGEALGVEARGFADAVDARNDLVLIELAGGRVVLIDHEHLAVWRLVANQNIDVVFVGALAVLDITVVAGHGDLPRRAIGRDAAAGRALRVLDRHGQAVIDDMALAVVACLDLRLARLLVHALARRRHVLGRLDLDGLCARARVLRRRSGGRLVFRRLESDGFEFALTLLGRHGLNVLVDPAGGAQRIIFGRARAIYWRSCGLSGRNCAGLGYWRGSSCVVCRSIGRPWLSNVVSIFRPSLNWTLIDGTLGSTGRGKLAGRSFSDCILRFLLPDPLVDLGAGPRASSTRFRFIGLPQEIVNRARRRFLLATTKHGASERLIHSGMTADKRAASHGATDHRIYDAFVWIVPLDNIFGRFLRARNRWPAHKRLRKKVGKLRLE